MIYCFEASSDNRALAQWDGTHRMYIVVVFFFNSWIVGIYPPYVAIMLGFSLVLIYVNALTYFLISKVLSRRIRASEGIEYHPPPPFPRPCHTLGDYIGIPILIARPKPVAAEPKMNSSILSHCGKSKLLIASESFDFGVPGKYF